MSEASALRRYCVHLATDGAAGAQTLEATGFESAALVFVEGQHAFGDTDDALTLYVEDLETGQRQCFQIDLSTGEAEPCD
jgi:hypothetical protein